MACVYELASMNLIIDFIIYSSKDTEIALKQFTVCTTIGRIRLIQD